MSQSFHLYQLQKIDTQSDQNDRRITEIEKSIRDDAQQIAMQEKQKELQNEFSRISKELRSLEDEIQQKRIKIEQSNNALFSGKIINPKELQDLQTEVSSLKKAVSVLEEEQLQKLILQETAEKEIKVFSNTFKQFQADQIARNSGLEGEISKLRLHNLNLTKEREIILSQIDNESQSAYQQLRKKKQGIAVAEIVDSVCNACGSELTPAECQKARSPQALTFCSSCGRILYAS
jgi:predicted  nucleic acid-binding Zn-ribbon protein